MASGIVNIGTIFCNSCQIEVSNNERNDHYRSDWHRYNIKRRCASLPPIPKQIFEAKLQQMIQNQIDKQTNKKQEDIKQYLHSENNMNNTNNENQINQTKNILISQTKTLLNFYCKICKKKFKNSGAMENHLKTRKHSIQFYSYLRKQQSLQHSSKKLSSPGLSNPSSSLPSNLNISQNEEGINHINLLDNISSSSLSQQQPGAIDGELSSNPQHINPSLSNPNSNHHIISSQLKKQKPKTSIDDNDLIEIRKIEFIPLKFNPQYNEPQPEDEEEVEEIKNEPLSIGNCLFCTEMYADIDHVLKHMMINHGFFIPFENRLKSLQNLLMEAGIVIGKYNQCVWCFKIFKSLKGVQSHMRHHGHCKLQIHYGITGDSEDEDMNEEDINEINEENENEPEEKELQLKHKKNQDSQSIFSQYFDWNKKSNDYQLIKHTEIKRQVIDLNSANELVCNDGKIIGHKDNRIVYRQLNRWNPMNIREEALISQINNPNRKFKMLQMIKDQQCKGSKDAMSQQKDRYRSRDDFEIDLNLRSHKLSLNQCKNQNRIKGLY